MSSSLRNVRLNTTPLTVPRSNRVHTARGLTSLPAGKMVPIAAVPLLREDSVRSGRLRFSFESMETAEVLMNAINVQVLAYLVPHLAFERFEGSMDQLNRSFNGEPFKDQDVVPYIETAEFGEHGENEVYKYLGLHAQEDRLVNTAYLEAYNLIWNFRAKNRSQDIIPRTRLQDDLAVAFWQHERFKHIVPDFDQAVIDGEVALNVVNSRLPVTGIGLNSLATGAKATDLEMADSKRQSRTGVEGWQIVDPGTAATAGKARLVVEQHPNGGLFPGIFAELAQNGITVSLSNIELARKTQAFARLREQYEGHSDEWIINMLMDGLTIPELAFTQPMLIGQKQTIFGMSKRYATDGENLTESVVNGATFVDMSIQLPRVPTGGVIMIVAEITPDQLFERQRDPYLHLTDARDDRGQLVGIPQYLRDTLDPEKVSIVPNEYVDVDHDTPNATFGYAPLNYEWNIEAPRIGGRFYRPEVDAGFDEDRQRIWAVEVQNPVLSQDFYLCTTMHTKPFVVTDQDPFEVVTQGDFIINGNTVFGGVLVEATANYEKVAEVAPTERIDKDS